MKNQHEKITGYRDLTREEIDLMNKVKQKGVELGELIQEIEIYSSQTGGHAIDMRWLDIGRTDLQTGTMALVRSIARPTTF